MIIPPFGLPEPRTTVRPSDDTTSAHAEPHPESIVTVDERDSSVPPPDDEYAASEAYDTVDEDGSGIADGVEATVGAVPTLLEAAYASSIPLRHLTALMAATELDDAAPPDRRIGYRDLFVATCECGARHWMDPVPGLREINTILERYLAPRETIRPVVALLTRLARTSVSPYAFLTYVVLPRLRDDRNWRRWGSAHLPVIARIADLVMVLAASEPFADTRIGPPEHAVLTDVFLVKYVAAVLIGHGTLDQAEAIASAWRSLALTDHGFLLFLRYTVRPFFARLGARLDVVRYLEIVNELPAVEAAMHGVDAWRDGSRVVEALLYGLDAGLAFDRRERRGFKAIHLLREFRAMLRIHTVLLGRTGGAAALGAVMAVLRDAEEPGSAERVATLMELLVDTGGRHIYVWHATRLRRATAEAADAFIAAVRLNGAHPDYPRYGRMFAHDPFRFVGAALAILAARLGIAADTGGEPFRPATFRSPRDVLAAYVAAHPEAAPVVARFKADVAAGRDASWGSDEVARFDTFDGTVADEERVGALHALLLFAVIRGLSGHYTRGVRTHRLAHLWSAMEPPPLPAEWRVEDEFTRDSLAARATREVTVRTRVNTAAFAAVWRRLSLAEGSSVDVVGAHFRQLAHHSATVREAKGAEHAATRRIAAQMAAVAAIQDGWERWPPVGRMCAFVLLGGYFGRKAEPLLDAALASVRGWIAESAHEAERLAFLAEDVDPDSIQRHQAEYLVSFLTDVAETLAIDTAVAGWLESIEGTDDGAAMAPLALTRRKEITSEAVDAAFRSVVNLSVLSKELARWREGVTDDVTGAGDDRRDAGASIRPERYRLFSSRTPIDSYFGDMGATCLSASPEHVIDAGFVNLRLADAKRDEIVGMAAMQLVDAPVASMGLRGFWFAFAFNPLRAVMQGLGETEQLNLYLRFRALVARVAATNARPVLLPGVTSYGVVSNDTAFANLIIDYEKRRGGRFVSDARGFALQYPEAAYAHALMVRLPHSPGVDRS